MMKRYLLLILVAVLPLSVLADGLTIEQVAQMRMVGSAAISPQGGQIAYTVIVPRTPFKDDDGAAWSELHVTDTRGNSRPFVTGPGRVAQIDWLADGSMITFLANRADDKHTVFYGIPSAGGEARRLVALETAVTRYAVSPDGTQVALLAREPEPAERAELRRRGFSQKIHEEDWLETGVWIAPINGEGEARRLPVEGTVHQLKWSPDGTRLALAVAPTPSVDDSLVMLRVRVVDANTGDVLARIENPGKLGDLAWSPDGEYLALLSVVDQHDPREGRLVVVPSAGGEQVDLIPGLLGHVWSVDWIDARTLAFISHEGTYSRLGTIRRDGRNQRTVLRSGGPVWTSLSIARNGEMALTASTPAHPTELFHLPRNSSNARRLTNSNPWLDDVRLARQEVVRYPARDGLEIEGILIYPLDYQEGQRYPLILQVHGGPEAHYSNAWLSLYHTPGQAAASRGFAVFYPNYRASTGRGVEFSMLDHYDPAGKEFDDYVDGVDHLIEMGLVDRERVGITGGSYGGYATAWGSTFYSHRFAAGVMSVGISDATMMMALGDIPWEMYLVHLRVWPWENWDLYRERSPLFHVTKHRTPLLILHGEADTRVHPGHSLALFRMLKVLDQAPVRLVLYPGEGHGNQRAASRYDYSLRQMRWFEHYLQGEGGAPPPYELDYSGIRP